jgi:hypothetical protein
MANEDSHSSSDSIPQLLAISFRDKSVLNDVKGMLNTCADRLESKFKEIEQTSQYIRNMA